MVHFPLSLLSFVLALWWALYSQHQVFISRVRSCNISPRLVFTFTPLLFTSCLSYTLYLCRLASALSHSRCALLFKLNFAASLTHQLAWSLPHTHLRTHFHTLMQSRYFSPAVLRYSSYPPHRSLLYCLVQNVKLTVLIIVHLMHDLFIILLYERKNGRINWEYIDG